MMGLVALVMGCFGRAEVSGSELRNGSTTRFITKRA